MTAVGSPTEIVVAVPSKLFTYVKYTASALMYLALGSARPHVSIPIPTVRLEANAQCALLRALRTIPPPLYGDNLSALMYVAYGRRFRTMCAYAIVMYL
jgi:hypothetical protein